MPTVDLTETDNVVTPVGTGTLFTLTLDGISLDAGDASTTLTIDNGDLSAYGLQVGSDDWFAVQGHGFTIDARVGTVALGAQGVNFELNTSSNGAAALENWAFAGGPSFPSASYFELDGNSATISLSDFASVTIAAFSLIREAGLAGPGSDRNRDALRFHPSGVDIDAGSTADSTTLGLNDGTLDVYGFGVGTNDWLALDGSGFTVTAALGPASLGASGAGFTFNMGPNGDPITDWSFAKGSLSPRRRLVRHLRVQRRHVVARRLRVRLGGHVRPATRRGRHRSDRDRHAAQSVAHRRLARRERRRGEADDRQRQPRPVALRGGAAASWMEMKGSGFTLGLGAGSITLSDDDTSSGTTANSVPRRARSRTGTSRADRRPRSPRITSTFRRPVV